MIYRCENCGDEVREPKANGEWDCVICGGRMRHTGTAEVSGGDDGET